MNKKSWENIGKTEFTRENHRTKQHSQGVTHFNEKSHRNYGKIMRKSCKNQISQDMIFLWELTGALISMGKQRFADFARKSQVHHQSMYLNMISTAVPVQ